MPLREFLNEAGYTAFNPAQGDVRVFIAGLIQSVLSLVGVIFLVIIIYGGYLWLTAGGNDEQVQKARKYVTRSVVGFLITIGAMIITRGIATALIRAHFDL